MYNIFDCCFLGFLQQFAASSSYIEAEKSLAIPTSLRKLQWSFIGRVDRKKSERKLALDLFSSWHDNFVNSSFPVESILDVYRQSKFVLSPRGWHTIDCFRNYEAIIAGAIPILVGPANERDLVFDYNGDKLEVPVYTTWEEALAGSRSMTDAEIDARRLELVRWFQRQISIMQSKLLVALNITTSQYRNVTTEQ